MKTAEEKAKEFVAQLPLGACLGKKIVDAVVLLCEEQDRDTRHACAEAVMRLGICTDGQVSTDEAHAACMNVKAC